MAIRVNIASSFDPKGIDTAISSFSDLKRVASDASLTFGEKASAIGDGMVDVGKGMTTKVTLPIVAAGGAMLSAFSRQEDAVAKMESVLDSTGHVAGITSEHIQDLAASLQETTKFGDETTIGAAALLATFKTLTNGVGEGNNVFDRTIMASQDLAELMGTDLNSATMMLGKAMQDPAAGLEKLTRAGVNFTDEQQAQIKAMSESGDLLGAQKVMLGEIESQFGGTAEAMAQTTSGKMKQSMNALGDAMEQFGEIIAPAIGKVVEKVTELGRWIQNLTPAQKEWAVRIAAVAAAIGPLLIVGGKMVKLVGTITTVIKGVGLALNFLAMNPVGLIVLAVAGLVAALVYAYHNFEGFRNVVDTVAAAIAQAFTWLWETVLKPIWDLIYWYIENVLIKYIQLLWTVYSTVFKAIASIVTWAWNNVIKPVWDAIYSVIVNVLVPAIQFYLSIWQAVFNGVVAAVKWAWENGIRPAFEFIKDGIGSVADWVGDKVEAIGGFFSGIGDTIKDAFKGAFNFVARAWNNTVGKLKFEIPSWVPGLGGKGFSVPNIPEFAKGGIVPGIPGEAQLAMVHGGEMILRRSQIEDKSTMAASQSSGDVNVYVTQSDADPYQIGQEILWRMKVAG